MANAKILLVDDDEAIRRSLAKVLRYEGFQVELATNGPMALNMALQDEPDLILLDIKMPRMDGLEVLSTLIKQGTKAPVLMISGHGTVQTAVEATRLGAFNFIEKPLDRDRLLIVCRNALEKKMLQDRNAALEFAEDSRYQIIGNHPKLLKLLDKADRVAPTNATVLITGQSGTGKELLARRVHQASNRAGPFVQINCAAIPEELIESELFGHAKGAFTGAHQRKIGKFESADTGTLFLDEVADMSLNTQAKVLRVLQESEFQMVGSNETRKINVRVIAATNKNLEDLIDQEKFREDLYFRLNVVPLISLPLNERKSDIPLLVEHIQNSFRQENHLNVTPFSPETILFFQQRSYRGNIRELKNLVERMLILGEQEVIESLSPASSKETLSSLFEEDMSLKKFKEHMEKNFLIAKLKQNHGNVSRTAEAIDTPRSNLYKKLELYKIKIENII